ncbi:hypothetical protein COLO4_00843, partial [Corchorus olitorius]
PGRLRTVLRLCRHRTGRAARSPAAGPSAAHLRHHAERDDAGHTVLHPHGADTGAKRHGRGPAGDRGPALRPRARRRGLCGDLRGRAAGGDHGRGRGIGDLHGPDLPAHHDALRL